MREKKPLVLSEKDLATVESLWEYLESGSGDAVTRADVVRCIEKKLGESVTSKKWLMDKLASLRPNKAKQ